MDAGADSLANFLFQSGNVRVFRFRWRDWRRGGVSVGLRLGDQRLGGAHRELIFDDLLGNGLLSFGVRESQENFGVTGRDFFVPQVVLDFGGQFEEPEGVGDGGAAFANLLRGFVLSEIKLLDKLLQSGCFFDGIQVFALEVFDERQFHHFAVVRFANDGGDSFEACQLRGAPTAFAGDDLEFAAAGPNNQGLDDSLGLDGFRKFLERGFVEFPARLEWARMDLIHPKFVRRSIGLRWFERGRRDSFCRRGYFFRNCRRSSAQQRAKTTSKGRLCHVDSLFHAIEDVKIKASFADEKVAGRVFAELSEDGLLRGGKMARWRVSI